MLSPAPISKLFFFTLLTFSNFALLIDTISDFLILYYIIAFSPRTFFHTEADDISLLSRNLHLDS